jgi:hypothetical protein
MRRVFDLGTQRLAAQALGHHRILCYHFYRNMKSQLIVRLLSLGQVACSRVLGKIWVDTIPILKY